MHTLRITLYMFLFHITKSQPSSLIASLKRLKVSVPGFLLGHRLFESHQHLASNFRGLRSSTLYIPENEDVWVAYLSWLVYVWLTQGAVRYGHPQSHVCDSWVGQTSTWQDFCPIVCPQEEHDLDHQVYPEGQVLCYSCSPITGQASLAIQFRLCNPKRL